MADIVLIRAVIAGRPKNALEFRYSSSGRPAGVRCVPRRCDRAPRGDRAFWHQLAAIAAEPRRWHQLAAIAAEPRRHAVQQRIVGGAAPRRPVPTGALVDAQVLIRSGSEKVSQICVLLLKNDVNKTELSLTILLGEANFNSEISCFVTRLKSVVILKIDAI